jgi:hypothetical protein
MTGYGGYNQPGNIRDDKMECKQGQKRKKHPFDIDQV